MILYHGTNTDFRQIRLNMSRVGKDFGFGFYLTTDRNYRGIIGLELNPQDGVVKQTGVHRSHYTWWRTKSFQTSNLKMLTI